jgi:hypothetical protein
MDTPTSMAGPLIIGHVLSPACRGFSGTRALGLAAMPGHLVYPAAPGVSCGALVTWPGTVGSMGLRTDAGLRHP